MRFFVMLLLAFFLGHDGVVRIQRLQRFRMAKAQGRHHGFGVGRGDRKGQDSGQSNQQGFHDRTFQVEHTMGRKGFSARFDLTMFFFGLIQ